MWGHGLGLAQYDLPVVSRIYSLDGPVTIEEGMTFALETQHGKTITDVAFSWGFSSSSHFSRVFRKHFGFVPSAIHKAHCADPSPDVS